MNFDCEFTMARMGWRSLRGSAVREGSGGGR